VLRLQAERNQEPAEEQNGLDHNTSCSEFAYYHSEAGVEACLSFNKFDRSSQGAWQEFQEFAEV
jgi:hypothetical protein